MGAGLVPVALAEHDHVDDGLERSVEQDLERPFGVLDELGPELVDRGGGSHRASVFPAPAGPPGVPPRLACSGPCG